MNTKHRFYDKYPIQSHPWLDIEVFYLSLISKGWTVEPMLALIKYIRATKLHERLFAYTSLDKLVVSFYDRIEPHRETLHIRFNHNLQQWHFFYLPKPFEPAEFERFYSADKGIEKFDSFIRMLKW